MHVWRSAKNGQQKQQQQQQQQKGSCRVERWVIVKTRDYYQMGRMSCTVDKNIDDILDVTTVFSSHVYRLFFEVYNCCSSKYIIVRSKLQSAERSNTAGVVRKTRYLLLGRPSINEIRPIFCAA